MRALPSPDHAAEAECLREAGRALLNTGRRFQELIGAGLLLEAELIQFEGRVFSGAREVS